MEVLFFYCLLDGAMTKLAVILAAFYGLRRSEVVGLKWTAINFENKTIISNRHTVTPVYFEGQEHIIERTMPKTNQVAAPYLLCKPLRNYCCVFVSFKLSIKPYVANPTELNYEEYIYLDKLGQRIKPGYITQNFTRTLKKMIFVIFAITTCVIVVQAFYSLMESV